MVQMAREKPTRCTSGYFWPVIRPGSVLLVQRRAAEAGFQYERGVSHQRIVEYEPHRAGRVFRRCLRKPKDNKIVLKVGSASVSGRRWGGLSALNRPSKTLGRGGSARELTTAIGSGLVNTLYVLDEPSVGLHPRDNERLMDILNACEPIETGRGDRTRRGDCGRADHIIDVGPGPGEQGGQVVYQERPRVSPP